MSGRMEEHGAWQPTGCQSTPAWRERCSNKKQQKRVIQGEEVRGTKRATTRAVCKREQQDTSAQDSMLSLVDCFEELTDPRVNRRRRHLLIDIIVVAMYMVPVKELLPSLEVTCLCSCFFQELAEAVSWPEIATQRQILGE